MARPPITRFVAPGDDLAPDFFLDISGKGAEGWGWIRPLISGVSYEEDEEMASEMELSVINRADDGIDSAESRGAPRRASPSSWYEVIDCKAFQEGNYVDLYMGYGGVRNFMGRGEIVKWMPTFGPEGPTSFVIKARDGRHQMMVANQFRVKPGVAKVVTDAGGGKRKRSKKGKSKSRKRKNFYRDVLDDEVVRMIARKYGYGTDTDTPTITRASRSGRVGSRVQPTEMSDWAFLQKLAAINRFDLWVDWDLSKNQFVIHFKERKDIGTGIYLFEYNGGDGSLIEAQPDFAIDEQPTDVEVLYFDRTRRKIQRTVISDTNPAEDVNLDSAAPGKLTAQKTLTRGARVRFSAFGQVVEAIADRPFKSEAEAKAFVKHWLKERERDFMILKGRVVGVETLRPRQVHQIAGLGNRIDGLYRFTKTKHLMQPGSTYSVEFMAYKVLSQEVARRPATTSVRTTARKQAAG